MPWTGLILHNEGSPFNIMSRNLPEKIYSQIQRYWVQTLIDKILVTIAIAFLSNGTLGLTKKIVWQFLSMPLRSRSKRCLKNFTPQTQGEFFSEDAQALFWLLNSNWRTVIFYNWHYVDSSTVASSTVASPTVSWSTMSIRQLRQFVNYQRTPSISQLLIFLEIMHFFWKRQILNSGKTADLLRECSMQLAAYCVL